MPQLGLLSSMTCFCSNNPYAAVLAGDDGPITGGWLLQVRTHRAFFPTGSKFGGLALHNLTSDAFHLQVGGVTPPCPQAMALEHTESSETCCCRSGQKSRIPVILEWIWATYFAAPTPAANNVAQTH